MKRRNFVNWIGLGWLGSVLPVAITAWFSPKSISAPAKAGNWQKIGTVKDLDKTGQLLAENSPVGAVLVVGTSKSKSLIAVNPTCTHKGCTVAWQTKTKNFVCPCHQAEFGADGKVQKKPASKSLKTYAAKIDGNSVLVKKI